jgi:secreted PhoX family phosphatase
MHATTAFNPNDRLGGIMAIEESMPAAPGASDTFTFWVAARGTSGEGPYDFANPDNLMIDGEGGLWFGTDGNFGTNGHADAVYYLDLDAAHRTTATATYGRAFRIAAVASDAEATGPALSSDQRTLFLSVQHPGEDIWSTWPDGTIRDRPRPALVALTRGR